MENNPFYRIKNGIVTFLRAGFIEVEKGVATFTPDDAKDICPACRNTGKIYVDYGKCSDSTCTAHQGYEDCEVCNIRPLRK